MPRTPDRFPGPREDEAIVLDDQAAEPLPGEIRNVSGTLKAADAQGVFVLRGITGSGHEMLDTLVHRLAENAHLELVRDVAGRVTSSIHWTDPSRTTKVREAVVTRDGQRRVSQLDEKQYDAAGVLIATLTTVFTRAAGGRVTSADVTRS